MEAPQAAAQAAIKERKSMYEREIWVYLTARLPPAAAAGIMGNLYAESGLNPRNLQNAGNKRLGVTDDEYTEAVDSGEYNSGNYNRFANDGWGYGIAQWTYKARKAALLNFAEQRRASIGDLDMQMEFLWQELQGYTSLIRTLGSARTVREASDAFMTQFERPADQSETAKAKRAAYAQKYYDQFTSMGKMEGKTMGTIFAPDYGEKYIKSTATHYIANSGSDENKAYKGGKAGDQTGHEAELKKWYNRPWTVILRWPNQAVALVIAQLSIAMCLNDKIGYDQTQRNTYWNQLKAVGYDPRKITTACEEDCTAGVSANVKAAGYICGIKALQDVSICSSRNMRSVFTKAGFVALTAPKYLTSPIDLLPGDILLYESHHAAANITIGKNVRDLWDPEDAPEDEDGYTDDEDEYTDDDLLHIIDTSMDDDDEYDDDEWEIEPPFVTITGGSVNVRKGPSPSYESMGIAHSGDRLHYFGYADPEDGWLLVEYDRATGWVSPKYAEVVT